MGWIPTDMVQCVKVENLLRVSAQPRIVAGPAVEVYREEIRAVFGEGVSLAPLNCCHVRGETVAEIARRRIQESPSGFEAENVGIEYFQSHGALTVEQRKIKKREGRSQ